MAYVAPKKSHFPKLAVESKNSRDPRLYGNYRLGRGVVSATAQERHGIDEDEEGEDGPEEEAKGNGGLGRAAEGVAVALRGAPVHGEGDGAGEPEDHGDPLKSQREDPMEKAGVVEGRREEVDEHQQ